MVRVLNSLSPWRYWRSTHGHEVDFLIGEKVAIEVKSARRVTSTDYKGLEALAEEDIFSDFFLVSQDPVTTRRKNIHTIHWKDFLENMWLGNIIEG